MRGEEVAPTAAPTVQPSRARKRTYIESTADTASIIEDPTEDDDGPSCTLMSNSKPKRDQSFKTILTFLKKAIYEFKIEGAAEQSEQFYYSYNKRISKATRRSTPFVKWFGRPNCSATAAYLDGIDERTDPPTSTASLSVPEVATQGTPTKDKPK
ncbi:hypothetical protein PoB_001292600 [Plakobranchus ocellatus]|uniref:Uncharacterized protein n=1 Tax=Plakobranchus ocellatus TaxID=259542 RepID=A0AAV3YGI4_9GAST|nr:hypothetical protein PoB_001292600 [Plakobranchus ocellatus]